MRQYHQIYDNEHYNKLYPTPTGGLETFPSGYGAIPYSHGFVRNKMTPSPWGGAKIPAILSIYASAGKNYIEDTLNTDIYQSAWSGIGSNEIFVGLRRLNTINPYNYGPVSYSYDIWISGIVNPNTPSGCQYCDVFNGQFTAWSYASNQQAVNHNVYWLTTELCKDNSYPRAKVCIDRPPGTTDYAFSPLLSLEGLSPTFISPNNPTNQNFTTNIILSVRLTNFTFFSKSKQYEFIRDFGTHKLYDNPTPTYKNKPNMLDDQWIELYPNLTGIWYQSDTVQFPLNLPVLAGNNNIMSNNQYCDYTQARCFVRPHKPSGTYYYPQEVLKYFSNRTDCSRQSYFNRYEGFDNNIISINSPFFSGYVPTFYNFSFKNVNTLDSGLYCDNCSGYFSKTRQLINIYNGADDTADSFIFNGNSYFNSLYNTGILSSPLQSTTSSGYILDRYEWRGGAFDMLSEYHSRQDVQTQAKKALTNLTNICEFGCYDDALDIVQTSITKNQNPDQSYCSNFFRLDNVSYYYQASGEYKGWLDSYFYLGRSFSDFQGASFETIMSSYRFKKRICDDRNNNPRPCTEIKYNLTNPNKGFVSFPGGISGVLPYDQPIFSGGWTFEKYSNNPYEPYDYITNSGQRENVYYNSGKDISGMCDLINTDLVVTALNAHSPNVECRGKANCAMCSGQYIPTTLSLSLFDSKYINPKKTFLLNNRNDIERTLNAGTSYQYIDACRWDYNWYNNATNNRFVAYGIDYPHPNSGRINIEVLALTGLTVNICDLDPYFPASGSICNSTLSSTTFNVNLINYGSEHNPKLDCNRIYTGKTTLSSSCPYFNPTFSSVDCIGSGILVDYELELLDLIDARTRL